MKFIILGSSSGMPEPGKNLSAVYVKCNDKSILADCGEGVAFSIMRHNLDIDVLDAIAITHYHPDHVTGFFMLIQTLYLQKRSKPLSVYLPERIEEFKTLLPFFYTFLEKLSFTITFHSLKDIKNEFPFITTHENDHLNSYRTLVEELDSKHEMKSYSLKFHESNKSLLYTSDISSIQSIMPLLIDTDTCIVDAIHPKIEDFELIEYNVKDKIILTHGKQEKLDEIVQNNEKYQYALENKTYTV